MTEEIDTRFLMEDGVSPTLRKIHQELVGTNRLLSDMGGNLARVDSHAPMPGLQAGAASAKGFGLELGVVTGLAMKAVDAIVALGTASVRGAVDVADFAIGSASFKKNMIASFELMEGSVEKAKVTYRTVKDFADLTPFDEGDVMTLFKSVRAAGFEMGETQDFLAGVFDVASTIQPERQKQALEGMTHGLLKMQSQGKLTAESLDMIGDAAAGTAVNQSAIFTEIGKMNGITPQAARKLMESGGINAATGITAFLHAVQEGVDKGDSLGKATKKFGVESYEGQIASLHNRFRTIFEDVDIAPLTRMMTTINDILKPGSPTEIEISKFANETLGGMFKRAEELLTPENIKASIQTVTDFLKTATIAVGDLVSGFKTGFGPIPDLLNPTAKGVGGLSDAVGKSNVNWKEFGIAAGLVANAFTTIVQMGSRVLGFLDKASLGPKLLGAAAFAADDALMNSQARLERQVHDVEARMGTTAVTHGQDAGAGLASGLRSTEANVSRASEDLAMSVADATTSTLEIHSPSRVMMRLGRFTSQGFADGLVANDVQQPMDDLVASPSSSSGSGGGYGGGVQISVTFGDINVSGSDARGAGEALREETKVAAKRGLLEALEEMGMAS